MSIFCLHVITFCDSLLTMVTLLWEGWKALPQQIISNFYFCLPIGRNSSRAHRWCEPPNQSDSAPVAPVADVRMLFIDLFTIQYHNTFQAHHQASNRTQHCHVWLDPELPDGQTPGCANMHHHISTLTLTTGAPQPSRVLPGHTYLWGFPQLQHHQVCWQQDCHWSDHRRHCDSLQRGFQSPDILVTGQLIHLNDNKTKKEIVNYKKQQEEGLAPITINRTMVERINSFRFLWAHTREDLTHTNTITKTVTLQIFFLCRLRSLYSRMSETSTGAPLRLSWLDSIFIL